LNIRQLWRKEQGAAVCGRDDSDNGVGSPTSANSKAGNGGRSRGSKRAKPKSGSNSSGIGTGGGGDSGSRGSGSDNGDGGNVGDNTAAMAVVMAAPTWCRQWQRGQPMWVEVIFCIVSTYYYLHDSTYRCDNNCQAYGKTQKYFDSKHKCVLIGTTQLCIAKHICVFNLWGLFVKCTSRRTLIVSKMR
jgi:hypothetical protein